MKVLRFFTILLALLTVVFSDIMGKATNATNEIMLAGYQIVEIDMHNLNNGTIDFAWVAVVICFALLAVHQILSKQKMHNLHVH